MDNTERVKQYDGKISSVLGTYGFISHSIESINNPIFFHRNDGVFIGKKIVNSHLPDYLKGANVKFSLFNINGKWQAKNVTILAPESVLSKIEQNKKEGLHPSNPLSSNLRIIPNKHIITIGFLNDDSDIIPFHKGKITRVQYKTKKNQILNCLYDSDDNIYRTFSSRDFGDGIILPRNTEVSFIPIDKTTLKGEKRFRAQQVRKAEKTPLDESKKKLFNNISQWQSDAASERDISLLFYKTKEYNQIENGNKAFIIGSKGSGKSAIANYILKDKNSKIYKISEIVQQEDGKNNADLELKWQNFIYEHIIDDFLDEKLKSNYIYNDFKSDKAEILPQKVFFNKDKARVIETEFEAIVLASGGKGKEKHEYYRTEYPVFTDAEKARKLCEIVSKYSNYLDEKFYIIFDELQNQIHDNESICLLSSLMAAIKSIKDNLKQNDNGKPKIIPLVFLRNDTYSLIDYKDKDKWNHDLTISIRWNIDSIKEMLAHRISVADGKLHSEDLEFNTAWEKIFGRLTFPVRNGNQKIIFDFVADHTFMRPRDFVDFLQSTCEQSIQEGTDNIQWMPCLKKLSISIADGIQLEIKSFLPNGRENIFDVFKQLDCGAFYLETFKNKFIETFNIRIEQIDQADFNKEIKEILKLLYKYRVIGNVIFEGNIIKSLYQSDSTESYGNSSIKYGEVFEIHRSLWNAFQLPSPTYK